MTHGSYTSYVKQSCRCANCTKSMREYKAQWKRNRRTSRGQVGTARLTVDTPQPERRVTGISGMTNGQVLSSSGVRVRCRCGNSGYANKWIVGKVRKIDSCEACR